MRLAEYIAEHYRTGKLAAARDRCEILEYIRLHPGCKTFDIELELHHDRNTLDRHLKKLRESGQAQNGWWAP